MKKIFSPKLIIATLSVILLWGNFQRVEEIRYNDWRSNNITGYEFQEAPDYFKHLENRKITIFAIQELLILVSGLLLIKGLSKDV